MLGTWSVRVRTTVAATLVVAIAMTLAALALVLTVRSSLTEAAHTTAENRAEELASQVEAGSLPAAVDEDPEDDDDEPEELVWQVLGPGDEVRAAGQPLSAVLPREDEARVRLRGGDEEYVVAVADAEVAGEEVDVVVAVSLEDVAETTTALLLPLAVGVPALLLVVASTTWLVVGRALRPVDRIRDEVDRISGSSLQRRVPEPGSGDEIQRLAVTMNRMLDRLQDSQERQQQFVSDASHELRSPLASIRQAGEVSQAHPDALPGPELAEIVVEESVRMQQLVAQLLLLTRAGEGGLRAREEVDLDDIVLTAARRAQRRGTVVDTTGVAAARIRGDAAAIAQAVINLVDNAERHARSRIAVSCTATSAGAEIVVEDDGAGVPPTQRHQVFERFVRLDEARDRDAGGSGLGLAIVRAVAEAHGGAALVEESDLGGARFVLRMPASA